MLGYGLGAFKPLPAFLATILVGRHGLKPSTKNAAPLQRLVTISCDRSRYNIVPVSLVEAVAHQEKSETLW